jgi:hypothetical protein
VAANFKKVISNLICQSFYTVLFLILKRERDRGDQKRPHQNAQGWPL